MSSISTRFDRQISQSVIFESRLLPIFLPLMTGFPEVFSSDDEIHLFRIVCCQAYTLSFFNFPSSKGKLFGEWIELFTPNCFSL